MTPSLPAHLLRWWLSSLMSLKQILDTLLLALNWSGIHSTSIECNLCSRPVVKCRSNESSCHLWGGVWGHLIGIFKASQHFTLKYEDKHLLLQKKILCVSRKIWNCSELQSQECRDSLFSVSCCYKARRLTVARRLILQPVSQAKGQWRIQVPPMRMTIT